ncbi:hypothetical protein FSARC_137 [Fusarium sarcochroum]|uniref:Uncharacterized protein n=1 Tax=Fusarium sarcochroum TaxID=1208366 RepID=A0A8H4UCM6_9HYPO|nr:hypothetical protein FSARC_137 [Fusarium sarcochroum]
MDGYRAIGGTGTRVNTHIHYRIQGLVQIEVDLVLQTLPKFYGYADPQGFIGRRPSATVIGVAGHRLHQGLEQLPDLPDVPDIQNKGRVIETNYVHECHGMSSDHVVRHISCRANAIHVYASARRPVSPSDFRDESTISSAKHQKTTPELPVTYATENLVPAERHSRLVSGVSRQHVTDVPP